MEAKPTMAEEYTTVTIPKEYIDKIEALRKNRGLRSYSETVQELIDQADQLEVYGNKITND